MNSKLLRRLIIGCFVTVPILSSLISTVHLVDMYFLGNPYWISVTIAVAIEIGAVASFLTLSILSKLNKIIVWSMFFLLFFLQVWGNVYFSYDWVTDKIAADPNWLATFKEMMEFFSYEMTTKTAKMILAMVVGIPIPLMSLMLLKSVVDYIGTDLKLGSSIDPDKPKEFSELPKPEPPTSPKEPLQPEEPPKKEPVPEEKEKEIPAPEPPVESETENQIEETPEAKKDLSTTYFKELEEKKTTNQ